MDTWTGYAMYSPPPMTAPITTSTPTMIRSLFIPALLWSLTACRLALLSIRTRRFSHLPHHLVEAEAGRKLPRRKLLEAREPSGDIGLSRNEEINALVGGLTPTSASEDSNRSSTRARHVPFIIAASLCSRPRSPSNRCSC